jgi:hypothetical protein
VLDASQTYNQSWHDSTLSDPSQENSIIFTFTGALHILTTIAHPLKAWLLGNGIYVFGILATSLGPGTPSLANYTFVIDDEVLGNFVQVPERTPESTFQYNVSCTAPSSS